jgi:large subunit ribosomal protein L2
MPVKTFRPLTPSTRYITIADFSDITKTKPEKSLVEIRKKTGGRNAYGRVTARGIGGGHKQKIRLVDFKRNKHGVEATVAAIEYDPMRSARLALLQYGWREALHHRAGRHQGGRQNFQRPDGSPGNRQRSSAESHSGQHRDSQFGTDSRSRRPDGPFAGGAATLMSRDEGYAQIRLPSGEIRKINEECYATIGQVGNTEHENVILGKAGRSRHRGIRGITAVWRVTRWTIRTAAVRANPRAAAAGSS